MFPAQAVMSVNDGYYDPNMDYAAAIDYGIKTGASREVIDSLNRMRANKIAGEKLNYKNYTDSDIDTLISTGGSKGSKKKMPQMMRLTLLGNHTELQTRTQIYLRTSIPA